jgi:hypothetical protein
MGLEHDMRSHARCSMLCLQAHLVCEGWARSAFEVGIDLPKKGGLQRRESRPTDAHARGSAADQTVALSD